MVLALGTLIGAGLAAEAQVVVGGPREASVEVDLSVLDRLGPQPNLPGMVRGNTPLLAPLVEQSNMAPMMGNTTDGVRFQPYRAEKGGHKIASAGSNDADLNDLARAAQTAKPAKPAKPAKVAMAKESAAPPPPPRPVLAEPPPLPAKAKGPEISLPEIPKAEPKAVAAAPAPVAAEAPQPAPPAAEPGKPMQIAKLETAPPAPPPQPVQPASVAPAAPAPAAIARTGGALSIVFGSEVSRLPDAARGDLEGLAKRMEKDEGLSLQLLAYAEGDDASASKARRLSLSRALEIRKFLMELGIRSTRIEVRALGHKIEGAGPADRVDAVLASR
ncbi:MAG: lysophospholipase [Magnetospirillum sp.]|nr:lysophospholipase [Magnetospirillum sp.]